MQERVKNDVKVLTFGDIESPAGHRDITGNED